MMQPIFGWQPNSTPLVTFDEKLGSAARTHLASLP